MVDTKNGLMCSIVLLYMTYFYYVLLLTAFY